jgi:SAM-dependent methyltransferase
MSSDRVFHFDAGSYDRFMGRYSVELAPLFADFAGVGSRGRALDVGAGPGPLAAALADRLGAGGVSAAEPSEEFVAALRHRLPEVDARVARAEELPWEDASFDAVLAQLVVGFLADAPAAVAEMLRVARPGGVVAVCMWEEDGLELSPPLRAARRAAAPAGAPPPPELPFRSESTIRALLEDSGLEAVETTALEVASQYSSFDEFWDVATAMIGPDSEWLHGLDASRRELGRTAARTALGSPEGTFALRGRAAAARGVRAG